MTPVVLLVGNSEYLIVFFQTDFESFDALFVFT